MCTKCKKIREAKIENVEKADFKKRIASVKVPHPTLEQLEAAGEISGILEDLELKPAPIDGGYLSLVMERLIRAGQRLLQDPRDTYAALAAMQAVVSEFNLSHKKGGYYEQYVPERTDGAKKKVSFNSTFFCKTPIEEQDMVVVRVDSDRKTSFKYIQSCGKDFCCPACAEQDARINRDEIEKIVQVARRKRMSTCMLTLTVPHRMKHNLTDLIDSICEAFTHKFCNSATWRNLKYVGYIRVLEVTLGGMHGSHAHFHIGLVFKRRVSGKIMRTMRAALRKQWEDACEKEGLLDSQNAKMLADFRRHGVHLKRNISASYLTKQATEWKFEKGVVEGLPIDKEWLKKREWKASVIEHEDEADSRALSPFGFVVRMALKAALGLYTLEELSQDLDTVIEYICATHGKHHIRIQSGLRKKLELVEKTKKELRKDAAEKARAKKATKIVGGFDKVQFSFLRRNIALRAIKKMIARKGAATIEIVSAWFRQHGMAPVYSAAEAEMYDNFQEGTDHRIDGEALGDLLWRLKKANNESWLAKEEHVPNRSMREIVEERADKATGIVAQSTLATFNIDEQGVPLWVNDVDNRRNGSPRHPSDATLMGGVLPAASPIPAGVGG